MRDISIYTIIIISLNAIISFKGFSDSPFFNRYKFNPIAVLKANQYDRMLTSGFLHADQMHLIFNMITLYFFAPLVITIFGGIPFVLIFLGSILGGNLLALYVHKDNAYYNAIGASGGVSGVLFAAIANAPDMLLGIMFIIPMPAWIFAIGYLVYTIYGMKKQLGNIGHSAHLGGAIVGISVALAQNPNLLLGENQFYLIGMIIPIIIMGALMFQQKN